MMKLFVLFALVVCSNCCRFDQLISEDATSSQGCMDSEGNLHDFGSEWDSEWENTPEHCVCGDSGIYCCEKFQTEQDAVPTEITEKVIFDIYENGATSDYFQNGNEGNQWWFNDHNGSGDEK